MVKGYIRKNGNPYSIPSKDEEFSLKMQWNNQGSNEVDIPLDIDREYGSFSAIINVPEEESEVNTEVDR